MIDTLKLRSRGAELAHRTDQALAQSAMLREQAAHVMESAADIEEEVAAILDKIAAARPDAADRLRGLASEARKQAERTRRWLKEHAAQTAHNGPEGGAVPGADALRARGPTWRRRLPVPMTKSPRLCRPSPEGGRGTRPS